MNNFEIVKKGKLKIVVSTKEFYAGETVLFICCEEHKTPTQYTIQLDDNYHILDPVVKEINHSFDPNVKVNGHSLVATRKIKAGDEVKRNYYETEEIIVKEFRDKETGDLINTKDLYNFKHGERIDYFDEY
jgi:flagella basal body P-ring formation protein FlgA